MTGRPVLELRLGDVLQLRRAHPCGGREWLVDRLGADIGIRCRTCGRRVLVEHRVLERRVAGFVARGTEATGDPGPGDSGNDAGGRPAHRPAADGSRS